MSEKRRDSKNRILRFGESQRKDGRYAYKYTDVSGKTQFVYAWKLVPTDKTPAGKRDDISLREKEKEIQKDLDDGIDTIGSKMTVCELYQKYTDVRGNVRLGTKQGRSLLLKHLTNDQLGSLAIDKVKPSDAKEWAIRMKEQGMAYRSINNSKRSLKAAFYLAIQDDCVRKNPFDFQLNTVLEDDSREKFPLTKEQEKSLLNFIQTDKTYRKYYDIVFILLGTGLRVSELCGLTEKDIDFQKRVINVDHQVQYHAKTGYHVEPPKTPSSIRQIPMGQAVQEAFMRVVAERRESISVNGYTGFLFLHRNGTPMDVINFDSIFKRITTEYAKQNNEALQITPHTLRHTFCTNMANAGMNPKALQYIMGHANITMTLNYYAHATFESAQAEFLRLVP